MYDEHHWQFALLSVCSIKLWERHQIKQESHPGCSTRSCRPWPLCTQGHHFQQTPQWHWKHLSKISWSPHRRRQELASERRARRAPFWGELLRWWRRRWDQHFLRSESNRNIRKCGAQCPFSEAVKPRLLALVPLQTSHVLHLLPSKKDKARRRKE